ncbi:hypothetical protein B0H14DRAFT_3479668 [Mycena olivaceomarginata]|nr:hypothetical protein B0H14DRAFT_3479668 [Mycena olivaceomarginata]
MSTDENTNTRTTRTPSAPAGGSAQQHTPAPPTTNTGRGVHTDDAPNWAQLPTNPTPPTMSHQVSQSDIDHDEMRANPAAGVDEPQRGPGSATGAGGKAADKAKSALADRLSILIERANEKCVPLCNMIRKHFDHIDAQKEEDRDEDELVKAVKPLLQQAETILNETNGAIRGADPDNRLSNKAKRNAQDHKATPRSSGSRRR